MVEQIIIEWMKNHNWGSKVEFIKVEKFSTLNGIPADDDAECIIYMIPSSVNSVPNLIVEYR